jgi:CDP-6-deoxy-D-xylo-4-hexulose-3-dehydrase
LNPARDLDREKIFAALKTADIGFRIITGGCFLRHDTIKYYDYEIVGNGVPNAELAHDRGFFVGNHPQDLTPQIETLRRVLDAAVK